MEPEDTPTAKQRFSKQVPSAMNTQAAIEVQLETMISIWPVQSGYKGSWESAGLYLEAVKHMTVQVTRLPL
jgi:hypothetical protein